MSALYSEVTAQDGYVDSLQKALKQTLFLAKHLDDFAHFLEPGQSYEIIAARSAEQFVLQYPSVFVAEQASKTRSFSTSDFFRIGLFEYDSLIVKLRTARNVWLFQPYPWADDLASIGVKVLANPFPLHLFFNNKITFLNIMLNSGSEILKENIERRMKHFDTRYVMRNERPNTTHYDEGFVYAQRFSDGGSGVLRTHEAVPPARLFDALTGPIYRSERYRSGLIPLTQSAIVFANGVIALPPGIQVIVENERSQLSYMGTDYDVGPHIPTEMIATVSELTKEVGRVLSMQGYRGAMGCDYLLDTNTRFLYLIEINPRFQASAFLFSRLTDGERSGYSEARFLKNPYVLHLASFFHSAPHPHVTDAAKPCLAMDTDMTGGIVAMLRLRQGQSFMPDTACAAPVRWRPPPNVTVDAMAPYETQLFQCGVLRDAAVPQVLKGTLIA